MNTFKTTVVAPSGELFSENDVKKISVRTESGQITVLAKHTPIVSVLKIGQLKITTTEGVEYLAVFGGFLEVRESGEVIVLADEAKRPPEIDLKEAKQAKEETQKLLKKTEDGTSEAAQLQADLERATTELTVGSAA